jgi:hypothetical protein
MRSIAFRFAFTAFVLASSSVAAQDQPYGVDLRRRWASVRAAVGSGEEKLWLRLEERPAAGDAAPDDLPFHEHWLLTAIKERFEGVSAADVLATTTVRHDGTNRTINHERGIEVRGRGDVLPRVKEFFDGFQAGSARPVKIEMRVIGLGEPSALTDPTTVAVVATRLDFERRLKDLAVQGSSVVMEPVIKVPANQTATLAILNQVSYVKDFVVEVVQGTKIADPVIDLVTEGFRTEITPILDPDSGAVILRGNLGFSHLVRPMLARRLEIADAQVTVQVPSITSHRWDGVVTLDTGRDAIRISGLKTVLPGADEIRNVEVWCLVTVESPSSSTSATGKIVDHDLHDNVFVSFPPDFVADDPWANAPKEVTVYRGSDAIGRALLTGGWVLGGADDPKRSVIAVYHLAEGTPRDGDSVR